MSRTPFDDCIPEEQMPSAQDMLALLPPLLPAPCYLTAEEQGQMLARVRVRLQHAESLMGLPEEAGDEQPQEITQQAVRTPLASKFTDRRNKFWQFGNAIAAVLVIGLITSVASVFFNRHPASTGGIHIGSPAGAPVGTVSSSSQSDGLEVKLSITGGSYFLSELLAVDITLTNHRQQDVMLAGRADINICGGAFDAVMLGGEKPYYAFPDTTMVSCPPRLSTLAAGRSLTVHGYMPITKSGAITITAQVRVSTLIKNQRGTTETWQSSTSNMHWPTIAIAVSPQIPSDRTILLDRQGEDILVNAPASIRSYLLFYYTVSCLHGSGTSMTWGPLHTTKLTKPYCDDASRHWAYVVGAPGYAIAFMTMVS
ncbi:MAG TPA: hypothetical protein VFU49_07650 [Ktedonobacteraceae bacterium]|nr:hypothetical protein [Ktedonobacteraceae bacterium]